MSLYPTPKMYSYLTDDGYVNKKAKGAKKCVAKNEIRFEDYKDCLENNKIILKLQQRFRNEVHIVFTEKVNQTALNMSDEWRLQMFDQAVSYPCGRGAGTICRAGLT